MRGWIFALALVCIMPVARPDTAVPQAPGTPPTPPPPQPSAVPCRTVADCWLDSGGTPIKRPARLRGRALPRGDCGAHLNWLQNRLACDGHVCVVAVVHDRC